MNRIPRNAGRAVLIFAALSAASATAATNGLQDTGAEYKIGPKDLLEITVLGVPEIVKLVVRVSEEGRITLPLLGEVGVGNLTKFEVEKKLTRSRRREDRPQAACTAFPPTPARRFMLT